MKTGKEDSKEAYENVLDIKGETDNMNLYKLIDAVFQELGICKEDDKMLKVLEHKLSDLTLNSNSKGNGSPQNLQAIIHINRSDQEFKWYEKRICIKMWRREESWKDLSVLFKDKEELQNSRWI